MEAWIMEMNEQLKKMSVVMEAIKWENENLRWKNQDNGQGKVPDHSKHPKGEAHSASGINVEEAEKKKLHNEAHAVLLINIRRRLGRWEGHPQSTSCLTKQIYTIA